MNLTQPVLRNLVMATIVVCALLVVLMAAPVQARPVIGGHKDVCKNVHGIQTAAEIEQGYWEPKWRTQRPNDCRPGWRTRLGG